LAVVVLAGGCFGVAVALSVGRVGGGGGGR